MVQFLTFHVFLATILISIPSLERTVGWSKFVDPNNQFEILMPDTVTESRTKTETPVGTLEYVSYVSFAQGMSGNAHYLVSYCTYPAGTLHEDSTELVNMFFDETIGSSIEAIDGELIYKDRISHASHPGMLWKVKSDAIKLQVKSKALVVGDTYYCLQVTTSEASSLQHDGEMFFNSFKLLSR